MPPEREGSGIAPKPLEMGGGVGGGVAPAGSTNVLPAMMGAERPMIAAARRSSDEAA
jgi:hypothetical protein